MPPKRKQAPSKEEMVEDTKIELTQRRLEDPSPAF